MHMNEAGFKAKLRAKFKPHCYIQSITSPAVSGTPDLWLSAKNDLWIEVKYDPKTKGAIKPKLSALQQKWLDDRYDEGRNVAVIVGTAPGMGILYTNKNWAGHSHERQPLDVIIKLLLDGLV